MTNQTTTTNRNQPVTLTGETAHFTLTSERTGAAFTYKIAAAERGGWFVSLVNRPGDWGSYLGFIDSRERRFRLTAKSRLGADAPAVKAWAWTWERFAAGQDATGVRVERV